MMRLHTTKFRLALAALVLLPLPILLLGPARIWAWINYYWAASYGGKGWDDAESIQQTSDGGYVVAGSTDSFGADGSDFWVLKLGEDGTIQWQKTFGGSKWDEARAIRQTADGGFVVTGRTASFGAGDRDIWVLKLDGDGTIQWQKTYGGREWDEAKSIQQTSDGGYVVAGGTESFGAGDRDIWILKLDGDGTIQWQKTFGGTEWDAAWGKPIQQTSDGGYVVCGQTASFGAGETDSWVLKLDENGTIQWQKTYGGRKGDEAWAIRQTSDGGYVVAGETESFGVGESDVWVLKLDGNGTVQWQKTYGGREWDEAESIQQTSDGGYVVAGDTWSFGAGDEDFWVLKLKEDGTIQWQKTFGGREGDEGESIRQTADGGFVVAGETESFGMGDWDVWVLKLDGDGTIPGCPLIANSSARVTNTGVRGVDSNAITSDSYATIGNTYIAPANSWASVSTQCYHESTPTPTPTPTATPTTGYRIYLPLITKNYQ